MARPIKRLHGEPDVVKDLRRGEGGWHTWPRLLIFANAWWTCWTPSNVVLSRRQGFRPGGGADSSSGRIGTQLNHTTRKPFVRALYRPLHPNPAHKRDVMASFCQHCGTDVSRDIDFGRLARLLSDILGLEISEGALVNMLDP
jgi:hypothetical protein